MRKNEISTDINGEEIDILPCSICSKDNYEMLDTIYPCNRERTSYLCACSVHNGGCGRVVYASSYESVVLRWNMGYTDELTT